MFSMLLFTVEPLNNELIWDQPFFLNREIILSLQVECTSTIDKAPIGASL